MASEMLGVASGKLEIYADQAANAAHDKKTFVLNQPDHQAPLRRWPPAPAGLAVSDMPGWRATIWRGTCARCPRCGLSGIFAGFLKVQPQCGNCGAPLGRMPADDAPPYIAMIVVLHLMTVFLILIFHFDIHPGIAVAAFLLVALAGICCAALRMAKGAVIGILLKLGLEREALRG